MRLARCGYVMPRRPLLRLILVAVCLMLVASSAAEATRSKLARTSTGAVVAESCGDGVVDAGESCDDGNHTAGDGCDAECRLETAKLDWWRPAFSFPDTTTSTWLLGEVVGTPAGILTRSETSFDVFQVQLFDPATGAVLHTFPDPNVFRIAYLDGDIWLADAGPPGKVTRYDGTTFEPRQTYADPGAGLVGGPHVFGRVFARVGDLVLVQNFAELTVEVFDAATGAHVRTILTPDTFIDFGAFIAPVGAHALILSADGAHLFDPATGVLVKTLVSGYGYGQYARGLDTHLLGDRILISTPGDAVLVFSATGEPLHTFSSPTGADESFGRHVDFIDGGVMIAGSGAVHVFDATTYALRYTIPEPTHTSCFGHPTSDTPFGLAVSDRCHGSNFDGIVYVFDHQDGHLVAALPSERGGFSEEHIRALGAYGTTLLVGHQEDESAANASLIAFQPCADGVLEPGEECDDGNVVNGDGCDLSCTLTRCGNAFVTAGEECDDGNRIPRDGCENDCTRTPDVCTSIRVENARLVVRRLGEPLGDETLVLSGNLIPPDGVTLDPLGAATHGAELRIVDASGTPLVNFNHWTEISPGPRGSGCGKRDGWRVGDGVAIYNNATTALGPLCTPGSAQGLRRLEIRRRGKDGGLSFRLRLGASAIPNPPDAVEIVLGLAAARQTPSGPLCAAQPFGPLRCARAARGGAVVCR